MALNADQAQHESSDEGVVYWAHFGIMLKREGDGGLSLQIHWPVILVLLVVALLVGMKWGGYLCGHRPSQCINCA